MKRFITILIMLFLVSGCGLKIVKTDSQPEDLTGLEQMAQDAEAATNTRIYHTLDGDVSGSLDSTDGADFADGDISFVIESDGDEYKYVFDNDGTDAQNLPYIVRPEDYAVEGEGVHILTRSVTRYPTSQPKIVFRDLEATDFDTNAYIMVDCTDIGSNDEDCAFYFYAQDSSGGAAVLHGVLPRDGDTGPGYLDFMEDSDNGDNRVRLIAPATVEDVTATLPSATGTILTTTDVDDTPDVGDTTTPPSANWAYDHENGTHALITNSKAAAYTIGTDDTDEYYGGVLYATGAMEFTLPAVLAGMHFTVIDYGGAAIVLDPDAGGTEDYIILDGTLLAQGANVTSTSTTGDIIVCMYNAADIWYCNSGGNDGDPWTGP